MNTTPASTPGSSQAEPLPMFYSNIEAVSSQLHKDLKIRAENDFSFAARINTVPLTVPEFTMVARHFPILLLGDELVPSAALGISPDQNLFVDADGRWDNRTFIPAYVRRYPFILLGNMGNDAQLTLGVDSGTKPTEGALRPLFGADGKETEVVKQALDLCEQFHNAFLYTREFSDALKKTDIVEDCTLEIEPTPGQKRNLGTFKRINEEKFKNLPDAVVLEWHKRGFLHAVIFLLQSMNNWDQLLAKAGMFAPRI